MGAIALRVDRWLRCWSKALLWCLCLALAGPVTAADRVRLQVDAGAAAGNGVPRVFGFSGNIWWTPEAFGAGLDERILAMPRLGLLRLSLGDQVLQHAASFEDLERRLAALPLNDFLRRHHAAGGRILIGLDGMPRYASANKSTELRKGPNLPTFRGSPPADYAEWSRIVEAVVRHFNGKLKLDAYYEAWNEPNYYYWGTNAQFMRQYTATVLGARRADARALVGGPCVSEIVVATTGGESTQLPADKRRITEQIMDQRYLFRQFLEHAARTPLPELGLARLPVDFFTWHAYYADPTRYYEVVVPYLRKAFTEHGLRADTPMFVTEWNIAPDLPYPEGDINANEVGAAYAATTLMAMHETGVDAQTYQMYVDPGVPGHYGGMFTNWGLPRASFQVFRLFTMLRGKPVRVRSDDRWVKGVAFVDGDTLLLLVSSLVPTPKMLRNDEATLKNLPNAAFTRGLVRDGLVDQVVRGAPLPPAAARQAREIDAQAEQRIQDDSRSAAARRPGLTLEIDIGGFGAPRQVSRYLIDSSHANLHPQLDKANRLLEAQEKRSAPSIARLRDVLREAGVSPGAADELLAALDRGRSFDDAEGLLPQAQRAPARRALEQTVRNAVTQRQTLLKAIENWPGVGLREEPVDWPTRGPLTLDIEGNSVQLFLLRR